jgi:hypothetical protein
MNVTGIGAAMRRFGWVGALDGCAWPNWVGGLEVWIMRWSAKPLRDSRTACELTSSYAGK